MKPFEQYRPGSFESRDAWRKLARAWVNNRDMDASERDYLVGYPEAEHIMDELDAQGIINEHGIITSAGKRAAGWTCT